MTNVDKKTKLDEMQMHIETSFDFINEHLPSRYVRLVQNKMIELGQNVAVSGTIRNVRTKGNTDHKYQNLRIITALLEVCKDVQKVKDGFIASASEFTTHE